MPDRYETARQPELAFATHLRGLSSRQLLDLQARTICPVRLGHLLDEQRQRSDLYDRGERSHG